MIQSYRDEWRLLAANPSEDALYGFNAGKELERPGVKETAEYVRWKDMPGKKKAPQDTAYGCFLRKKIGEGSGTAVTVETEIRHQASDAW